MTDIPLLNELGLAQGEDLAELARGGRGFAWRHLASGAAPIAAVVDALRRSDICPPRTGHLSDWHDIWNGCSTVLDYNAVLCRQLGVGYPLLFDFTQCETDGGDGGDTLFQPGALFRNGRRMPLRLRCCDGSRMVSYGRSRPAFVPYLEAAWEGEWVSLGRLHHRRAAAVIDTVDTYSQVIKRSESRVRELLTCLLEEAPNDHAVGMIFDRLVHRDGTVTRAKGRRYGSGFQLGEQHYPDAAALVDASLTPFQVATSADRLATLLPDLPIAPLASIDVVTLCMAVLGTHRPSGAGWGNGPDVHVHWGALAMAGAPPLRRGYFAGRVRRARWMYEAAVANLPWVRPIVFVLAPTAPFFLWLPEAAKSERMALGELLHQVHRVVEGTAASDQRSLPVVRGLINEWVEKGALTMTLRSRLSWQDRSSPDGTELAPSRLVPPDGIGQVPVSTACLLVGLLTEEVAKHHPTASGVGR